MSVSTGNLIADATIACASIVGLLIVINRYTTSGQVQGENRRLIALLGWLALFLAVRLLAWVTGLPLFEFANWLTAAFIPLFILILTEGLLRQHAPKPVKIFTFSGGVIFGLSPLWPGMSSRPEFTLGLMGFQLAVLTIIAVLIVLRDRESLSQNENRTIFRISLSLLFVLPFLIADYQLDFFPIPVSPSGLAILIICWLSLTLERPRLKHTLFVGILALYLATAIVAAILLSKNFGFGYVETVQAGSIIFALIMVTAIIRDDTHARAESTQDILVAEMMGASAPTLKAYLNELSESGILSDALLLKSRDLTDFDIKSMTTRLTETAIFCITDLPSEQGKDDLVQSQFRALFQTYNATHIYLVSKTPAIFGLTRQPGFTTGMIDRDLSAAFGLARLIAERDELAQKPGKASQ